jgi:hypothetical protein
MGSPAGASDSAGDPEALPDDIWAEPEPALPRGYPFTDEIRLIRQKGNWRIAEINREEN